jgi:hypothetical protein
VFYYSSVVIILQLRFLSPGKVNPVCNNDNAGSCWGLEPIKMGRRVNNSLRPQKPTAGRGTHFEEMR